MPIPVLAFLGGAAVGAVAAWLIKDRLDRRSPEDGIEGADEVAGVAGGRPMGAIKGAAESAAGAVQDTAEMVQAAARGTRSPTGRQRRTPKPAAP